MRYCYGYISNYRISKEDTVVKEYFSVIKSDKSKKYCKKLINKNRKLFKNKKFPSVELIDKNGKTMLSDSLMKDKRTIVSFWDLYRKKSFNSNLEKLLNLSKNYPKIQIVLLNRNYDEHEVWRRTIPKQTNVVFYQLKNKKDVMLLMPYSLAQTFLLKNDTIKGSMLNLYNVTFEKEFKQFATQK
jgi:ribosomal protein S6